MNIRFDAVIRRAGLKAAAGLAMGVLVTGCAVVDRPADTAKAADTARAGDPVGQLYATESRRDMLNDGYSALHDQLETLSKVDRLFYIKVESDDVQKVVEDLTGYCGQLDDRLGQLSQAYPALNLSRTTTPPIMDTALAAQRNGVLKQFAPLVGQSGTVFERGLLIRLLGAADQQRYLTAALAEKETDSALAQIMQNASTRFAALFDEINALLKAQYYR